MSCIGGIFNVDGEAIDVTLLNMMMAPVAAGAPDGASYWASGNVGLCHSLLHTQGLIKPVEQPFSIDGKVLITADARIDDQKYLRKNLLNHNVNVREDCSDTELILHAYEAFGEGFLEHLIGDFAFAIWDSRFNKLTIACDHFGIRPLFHAKVKNHLIFASDIRSLLALPFVGRELNETAIGDFLLFGGYEEPDLTIYKGIKRLPGAHFVEATEKSQVAPRRYWSLPETTEISSHSDSQLVEELSELLHHAVVDRITDQTISTDLSGGMDSTSIAAIAARHQNERGGHLYAHTVTARSILQDDTESDYAALAATFLNIPLSVHDTARYPLFDRLEHPSLLLSQPSSGHSLASAYDRLISISSSGAKVHLSGYMGDTLFESMDETRWGLLRNGNLLDTTQKLIRHIGVHRTLRGFGLRKLLGINSRSSSPYGPVPPWIRADIAKKLCLDARWEVGWGTYLKSGMVNILNRPDFIHSFVSPQTSDVPVVTRYPFLDLRLIHFFLSVPSHLKKNKSILRSAMSGRLPDEILSRSKTGLRGNLIESKLKRNMYSVSINPDSFKYVTAYVDPTSFRESLQSISEGKNTPSTYWTTALMLPIALEIWLRHHCSGICFGEPHDHQ